MAPIISYWNSFKVYNNVNANCQNFVEAMLKALDIDFSQLERTLLGSFFKKMKETGTCELKLEPNEGIFLFLNFSFFFYLNLKTFQKKHLFQNLIFR